jgi:hypothetical protein
MLPLIKQSVRTRSNAPILWFGDYVDFGSVKEVLSTFAKDQGVHIEVDFGKTALVRNRVFETPGSSKSSIDLKFSIELVVLLCHKFFRSKICWQHGQRGSVREIARAMAMRTEVIEFGT